MTANASARAGARSRAAADARARAPTTSSPDDRADDAAARAATLRGRVSVLGCRDRGARDACAGRAWRELAGGAAGRGHGWKPVLRDYEFDVPLAASFPGYAVTAGSRAARCDVVAGAQGLTWKADVRAYLFRVEIAQPGAVLGVDGGRELLRAEYALEYDSSKLTHNEQAFAIAVQCVLLAVALGVAGAWAPYGARVIRAARGAGRAQRAREMTWLSLLLLALVLVQNPVGTLGQLANHERAPYGVVLAAQLVEAAGVALFLVLMLVWVDGLAYVAPSAISGCGGRCGSVVRAPGARGGAPAAAAASAAARAPCGGCCGRDDTRGAARPRRCCGRRLRRPAAAARAARVGLWFYVPKRCSASRTSAARARDAPVAEHHGLGPRPARLLRGGHRAEAAYVAIAAADVVVVSAFFVSFVAFAWRAGGARGRLRRGALPRSRSLLYARRRSSPSASASLHQARQRSSSRRTRGCSRSDFAGDCARRRRKRSPFVASAKPRVGGAVLFLAVYVFLLLYLHLPPNAATADEAAAFGVVPRLGARRAPCSRAAAFAGWRPTRRGGATRPTRPRAAGCGARRRRRAVRAARRRRARRRGTQVERRLGRERLGVGGRRLRQCGSGPASALRWPAVRATRARSGSSRRAPRARSGARPMFCVESSLWLAVLLALVQQAAAGLRRFGWAVIAWVSAARPTARSSRARTRPARASRAAARSPGGAAPRRGRRAAARPRRRRVPRLGLGAQWYTTCASTSARRPRRPRASGSTCA